MFDLSNIINKYSNLLEIEESNTIRNQLNSFLIDYLLYNQEDIPIDMYDDFEKLITILNDENLESNDRLVDIIKSQFVHRVLTFKNNAREKELRRLTTELSKFIQKLGHKKINNIQHPQYMVAKGIKEVADYIEPRKYKNPKVSMNDAWCHCLIDEAIRRFK